MFKIYRKLLGILSPRERKRGAIVLLFLVLVAFSDTLGVASIMPFIAVLANPDVVETNKYLSGAFDLLGFESRESFLFFLGMFFLGMLITSLALRAIGMWAQLRFAQNRNHSWSLRLLSGYLRQPYEWFLNCHTSDLATSVLSEVNQVVGGALFPAMRVISNTLVVVFLLGMLVMVDPLLSISIGLGLGGGFWLVQVFVKRKLGKIGRDRRDANHRRFKVVNEGFGGIKDVKVLGREENLISRYQHPSQVVANRQIAAGLISELPPLAMQALLFGGMLLVLLYLMRSYGEFQNAVPVVALFAFAGYRLLPAVQKVYQDLSQLRFSEAALDALRLDFETIGRTTQSARSDNLPVGISKVSLTRELILENISYRYPGSSTDALSDISLRIAAYTTVGIVGSTGSGKTTMVDLLLGLLDPRHGQIVVDDTPITEGFVRAWRRSIGYVPQQIFLADETVAGNIAFGLAPTDIDMEAVERAARIANLHEFVESDLPQGYDTKIGEKGVRLSGGQRQRIGIARALYHDPDVLVMDEATSALDNFTERAVMEAVNNLADKKTVILIAHRLGTVKKCNTIFLMEKGQLIDQGTYDALCNSNDRFRELARLA